jgi:hypothetical protein
MRKTSTVWWPSALLVPVLLIGVAACGGDDDDDGAEGIASLSDDAESTETTDNGATRDGEDGDADPQQAALDFAECMREHGIDMPDPQVSEDGGVLAQVGEEGATPPDEEELQAAQEACDHIMEDAFDDVEAPDPEQQAEMEEQALAFAECMREHGIDMPDPQFDESGRVTQRIDADSGVDPGDPDFEAAQEACADELPGRPGQGLVPTGGGTDGDA